MESQMKSKTVNFHQKIKKKQIRKIAPLQVNPLIDPTLLSLRKRYVDFTFNNGVSLVTAASIFTPVRMHTQENMSPHGKMIDILQIMTTKVPHPMSLIWPFMGVISLKTGFKNYPSWT